MKKSALCILTALALVGSAAVAQSTSAVTTRTINYYDDHQVVVPLKITRVATSWEAQNSIIAMLGYGQNIVASTRFVRDMPIFQKFVPSIKGVPLASGGSGSDLNMEELIRLKPQVLFLSSELPPSRVEQLRRAGIATASFRANSLNAIVERTVITGEILGADAEKKALAYREYFNDNVARVRARMAKVPMERRLKIYHAVGNPLTTSGRPSLNQDWMDVAGVINVAENWFGGMKNSTGTVSLEQIIAADPDMIVAMRHSDAEAIRTDARWKNLRAVKNGKVIANPRGMFWWCRETSEEALQFLWLAKTAYPEYFSDIDMHKETQHFYKTFYGYELTAREIDEFLNPTS